MFFNIKIVIILQLIKYISSDCGLPAIPTNAKIDEFSAIYPEGRRIEYYCELPELTLLNGNTRVCINGQWNGSIPICAEEIRDQTISKFRIIDNSGKKVDNLQSIKTDINGRAFSADYSKGECISSRGGALKPVTFQVFLNRNYGHISYFEVVVHTGSQMTTSDVLMEASLNKMRSCVAVVAEPAVAPLYLMRLKLTCDFVSNSDEDILQTYYSNDFTNNITLKFDSNSISICEIRLFYRKYHHVHQCGTPDQPLYSDIDFVQYGSKYGETPYFRYNCIKNFKLIGNSEVRCGLNNYWLDDFPTCVPTIRCPILAEPDGITIFSYFESPITLNSTPIAIPGSKVLYECAFQSINNKTFVMIGDSVRLCTDSGVWSGIEPYCMEMEELQLDKYKELVELRVQNETNAPIRSTADSTDCGIPALPMYAKPSPTRFRSADIRGRYPNGTKLQYTCEMAFHVMYPQSDTRICVNRKWKGSIGRCEISHDRTLTLISIIVSEYSSYALITEWIAPEPNKTNNTVEDYYDYNSFGGWNNEECASFNVTEKQKWRLKLNDTQPITSFFITLKPGGIYGGFMSYNKHNANYSSKPIVAKVGRTFCEANIIYDWIPTQTYMAFRCDHDPEEPDYSSYSSGVDEIVLYIDPKLFDKKYNHEQISLCSLSIFHSSENCGFPDKPLNSIVYIENQRAVYLCEAGYQLEGTESVACLGNGKWAQESPVCKLKADLCSAPEYPGVICEITNKAENGSIILGTVVKFNCTNFNPRSLTRPLLIGSRVRICRSDGEWSGSQPYCIDSSQIQSITVSSYGMSTKAVVIIVLGTITLIVVSVGIALVVCCHISQKCYQCFVLCFNTLLRRDKPTTSAMNTTRPESRVDIREINATLEQLASFEPYCEQLSTDQTFYENNNNVSKA